MKWQVTKAWSEQRVSCPDLQLNFVLAIGENREPEKRDLPYFAENFEKTADWKDVHKITISDPKTKSFALCIVSSDL